MTVPADSSGGSSARAAEEEAAGPIIRDKRRIDPETGQVRETARAEFASAQIDVSTDVEDGADDPRLAALAAQVAERTADLQRVSAEFANYKKRVERDRQAVAEQALASLLFGLLPVLDDVDRARDHGELEGGVKSITDNLETTLAKLGLEQFGAAGEPFDPNLHEAMTHGYSADVDEQTCAEVFQPGYRLGERILRPARVAVVEPETPTQATEPTDT
ncbi:MAG: molecular chaperone GrpE [Frankiales bacterium]|jgi:molecular chaperone GrpE|nr:molecular chaperone GrpE [Frankiales bacterium]